MTDFTGLITAPCVCSVCSDPMQAPTLDTTGGRSHWPRWLMPCCEACKTAAYNNGVLDGKFEAKQDA